MPLPLILVHGYSDKGESFEKWKEILIKEHGYSKDEIHICSYRTLTNEITIKDIAEGFERALRINKNLKGNEPFDVMVHSTGMLVLRSWLVVYGRHERLKHLIALAPATFGSPMAHKGRSWIASIFKGNKERGPDFMEAGDLVLDGLELGSHYTWNLAQQDLFNEIVYYGPYSDTPYVFTFCGTSQYGGLRGAIANSPGTDGVVRWAGCTLNARKITLNFTKSPNDTDRFTITEWPVDQRTNLLMPFIPVKGLNHSSIIGDPSSELVEMVSDALKVSDLASYDKWIESVSEQTKSTLENLNQWQQFAVKARDERGDPIRDYNLQLYKISKGKNENDLSNWDPIKIDVHSYSADNSYRCFHIDLKNLTDENVKNVRLELMASSGTSLLGYLEYLDEEMDMTLLTDGQPTFTMDLSPLLHDTDIKFFFPFTTTLIEIILNREPLPFRDKNDITWFL